MIQRKRPLDELIRDSEAQAKAMQDSIDDDIERHRLLGHSISCGVTAPLWKCPQRK